MNSHTQKLQKGVPRRAGAPGIALVITLLMLSVITFLAITFLYMARRNKAAVSASLDQATARAMGDAALARAQTEIMAQMLAHGDALYYDYMPSTAYQSPFPFNPNDTTNDPNNVNYDTFFTNQSSLSTAAWVQNIANLQYDPRPPVFVVTNQAFANNYDFRFWVDVNRNGRFETNGYQRNINDASQWDGTFGFWNGEPEYIGVLRNPLFPHSSSNQFIGRYAYMILPVGKELDINYIHNFLKGNYSNLGLLRNNSVRGAENDGYARDQGMGSWELNLAGLLDAVSPWAYESATSSNYNPYNYVLPPGQGNNPANTGNAFDDAESILHYRYPAVPPLGKLYLAPINDFLPTNYADYYNNGLDMFCQTTLVTTPFHYATNVGPLAAYSSYAWPGSYQTNQFFDVQDLFDSNKTSVNFTNRMILASQRTNTFDRYTFQRLISSIAMGSSPEYGVWVNRDWDSSTNTNYFVRSQTLRTKININYDNTAQINASNAPYAPMPTNMIPWTPIGFFTNAAELLLRSQTFMYPNIATNGGVFVTNGPIVENFGLTNIPIYRVNESGIQYNSAVHRMLQLAANIYDATVSTNYLPPLAGLPAVRHPSVFRPIFGLANRGTTNAGINIVGYQQVSSARSLQTLIINAPFYDLPAAYSNLVTAPTSPAAANMNIWGIPWIVAADQGLPQFYQYSYEGSALYERKLLFTRYNKGGLPDTNRPPQFTNQFYCFCISNNFGMDGFNPYPSGFYGSLPNQGTTCYISNLVTIQFTNNDGFVLTTNLTNFYPQNALGGYSGAFTPFGWTGWTNNKGGFVNFISNTVTPIAPCYFSESQKRLVFFTNGVISSNGFLASDTNQTGWPVHNWTVNITNHIVYALFDGTPGTSDCALLDFVNLGPFGTSLNLQKYVAQNGGGGGNGGLGMGGGSDPNQNYWTVGSATDAANSPMSTGLLNQIAAGQRSSSTFGNNLIGAQPSSGASVFGDPVEPTNIVQQSPTWAPNDPMVHYTLDDLASTNQFAPSLFSIPPFPPMIPSPGVNKQRYSPWNSGAVNANNMLMEDPMVCGPTNWDFPTSKFPSVGWLGRVHRGTPWQTVYLKSDNPNPALSLSPSNQWNAWLPNAPWFQPFEHAPETYPTNDWALIDLFTTAPNDNAARGLLSVNQTNDAAWAAVLSGVIAANGTNAGVQIVPTNVVNFVDLFSPYGGINAWRTNYANGIFHSVGDILGAPALTVSNVYLTANGVSPNLLSDEMVELIPQQTLSLLKVGEPQFVIFAYGQALKGVGPPYLNPGGPNGGIYTNYEITGEVVTRTVCHVVHTNGVKMVVDSFNVESGSGN